MSVNFFNDRFSSAENHQNEKPLKECNYSVSFKLLIF